MLGERFAATLGRARGGDVDAFADLWRDAHPMLLRYLRVTAGDRAEDVASQTWIRVIESVESFEGGEPQFRRWVVTIARNLYLDLLRGATRRPELLVASWGDQEAERHPDAGSEVEERMSTEAALALIARLPAGQAEMVMLRVVLGLDVADVAAVVGKSPGAVRVAVHRGLRSLEEMLSGSGVTPEGPETFSDHDA